MIDFSDCEVNVFRSFNGANGSKLSIVYKGHDYVLKFPSLAKNRTDRSYANNCFSEHVCCGVLDTIGMDVQNTILGTYHEKIVVACRDFTEGGYKFADFGTLIPATRLQRTDMGPNLQRLNWQSKNRNGWTPRPCPHSSGICSFAIPS